MTVPTAEQWGQFELTVCRKATCSDPYRDVRLDVTYRGPEGERVEFQGFYDGGSNWKLRFMPDCPGRWRYAARFSDGQAGAQGTFECVPSDLPGTVWANERNPIWFGHRGGGDLLLRGFHVGDRFFAVNWPGAARRRFLDWAQAQGYNLFSIASHFLNRDAPGRGQGWDTPGLWPLDAGEFRKLEAILDELARRRMVVYPFAGFFGRDSAYPRSPADQELYVRYCVARLAPYWNLLWNVAGPEPNHPQTWMPAGEVERLGRLIARLDPFGHPLSVHNRTGDDPWRDSDWATYGTLQGPKTVDRRELSDALIRNHHPRKPLLAQETLWSGNKYHIRSVGRDYTDDDLRKNAMVICMSGAALCFGDMDGTSSSGFSRTLDPADRRQHRHDAVRAAWDLFEELPFRRMSPGQDLIDRGFCLADPPDRYAVYLEKPGTVRVGLGHGRYKAEWINAADRQDRRPAGACIRGDALSTPPGGDDWLLDIRRIGAG